jgi:bacillithiol system protein YtxJ
MLSWFDKRRDSPAAAPAFDLDAVSSHERAVIFKHSSTCPVSWAAQAEVRRFSQSHPHIPVFTVVVQEDRQLSRKIEEWSGITHESPQVIILHRGAVVTADSHEGVTAAFLAASLGNL